MGAALRLPPGKRTLIRKRTDCRISKQQRFCSIVALNPSVAKFLELNPVRQSKLPIDGNGVPKLLLRLVLLQLHANYAAAAVDA
jgi:hypothetical protein